MHTLGTGNNSDLQRSLSAPLGSINSSPMNPVESKKSARQEEIEKSAIRLKESINSNKENHSGDNSVQILIKSLAALAFRDKRIIFDSLSMFGRDAPLAMKINNTEGEETKTKIKNAKIAVINRLQKQLRTFFKEEEGELKNAPLEHFYQTYKTLEETETTQKEIYSDHNIDCTFYTEENQSFQQQIVAVAKEIVENLKIENQPESKDIGAYVFSILGNNSREGLEANLSVYLKVINIIETLEEPESYKNALLENFQQRAVFLCTGSAGKGTSLNYSVGKVAASLKPDFAKTIFNEDGSVKNLQSLKEDGVINTENELIISKDNLTAPQGLQQLTTKQTSESVTIKFFDNENNEITGAVVKEGDEYIKNPIKFPVRRSGKQDQPALLFGNTEAEFNESILKEQFELVNIQRKKENKPPLTLNIKVEPNSANTGQNMEMGAEKINEFCNDNSLKLSECSVVQAQRMQASARAAITSLCQFSTEGLGGPPAFKQLFNINAQFDASSFANQEADRQTIDLIGALKEFTQSIIYSLGNPEKAFYGALDISSNNFKTFMTLTQQLMIGLRKPTENNVTENNDKPITLQNALDFYNKMWPTLESKIKQGSDHSIKENLLRGHGAVYIRNTFISNKQAPPETTTIKKEFEKANKLMQKVSNLNDKQKRIFSLFAKQILQKVNGYITNPEKANRGKILKENIQQIKISLTEDNPKQFNQYEQMISSLEIDEENPFLTVANFAMQSARPLNNPNQRESPRTN